MIQRSSRLLAAVLLPCAIVVSTSVGCGETPTPHQGQADAGPLSVDAEADLPSMPDVSRDVGSTGDAADGPPQVGCGGDGHCLDPTLPYCVEGECVACRDASHCSGGPCVEGACVSCGDGPKPTIAETVWPTPTKTTVCQAFGNKISYQTCGFHTGIDICLPTGEPIVSIAAGKVVHVGPMWYDTPSTGRGPYAIIVQHSTNFYSTYGHNEQALVSQGDCVAAGDQIATVGSLGYSSGPHLHFEIVDGTSFTGDWAVPFEDVCAHYVDPTTVVAP